MTDIAVELGMGPANIYRFFPSKDAIKEAVREKYSQAALRAGSCCGGGERAGTSPITANLYREHETDDLPEAAVLASLGRNRDAATDEKQ